MICTSQHTYISAIVVVIAGQDLQIAENFRWFLPFQPLENVVSQPRKTSDRHRCRQTVSCLHKCFYFPVINDRIRDSFWVIAQSIVSPAWLVVDDFSTNNGSAKSRGHPAKCSLTCSLSMHYHSHKYTIVPWRSQKHWKWSWSYTFGWIEWVRCQIPWTQRK